MTTALLYHDIGDPGSGTLPGLTVATEKFARQIEWLARTGYRSLLPRDLIRLGKNGQPIPHKSVILTFDDAYETLHENALPVLARYGFRAAIFVVTDEIGGTNRWDQPRVSALPLMNARQIRHWHAQGFEFGAHSCSHSTLPTLTNSELHRELAESRRTLEGILDGPVLSFAYPYGGVDERVLEAARQYFQIAFTTVEGELGTECDLLLLPRSPVVPGEFILEFLSRAWLGRNRLMPLRMLGSRVKHGLLVK